MTETREATTPERRERFLAALRHSGGSWAAACEAASPGRESPNHNPPCYSTWRSLESRDPEFAAAVQEIKAQVRDDIIAELYRRAMRGTLEPVFQKGEQAKDADGNPAYIRRFSDSLLAKLAAARMPDLFGEKRTVEHRGNINVSAWSISLSDLAALSVSQKAELESIVSTIRDHRRGTYSAPAIEAAPVEGIYDETGELICEY